MIVIDTHILVWLNEDRRLIPLKMMAAMDAEPELRVSPISFWEIAMLESKGRIALSDPPLPWFRRALKYPGIDILPITPEIAARSGSLVMQGDPADRLIAATAIEHGCALASVDGEMPKVSGLKLIPY